MASRAWRNSVFLSHLHCKRSSRRFLYTTASQGRKIWHQPTSSTITRMRLDRGGSSRSIRRWIYSSSTSTSNSSGHSHYLQSVYRAKVARGELTDDVHQREAMRQLDRLYDELQTTPPPPPFKQQQQDIASKRTTQRNNSLFGFFTRGLQEVQDVTSLVESSLASPTPRGVYLHGGVGCGKTFCMNLFYEHINNNNKNNEWAKDKQHVHFHKFMLGVHQQMHEAKRVEGIEGDVLPRVIARTLERGRLLCFDEFQVTDVADALILRRLFTGLFEQGAIVVATSNRPPDDLYLNGLQRDLFLPFIDLLKERCEVVSMWESETDYRLIQGEQKAKGVYFVGKEAKKDFKTVFHTLTKGRPVVQTTLSTQGRAVPVPMACLSVRIARFTFEDLCTKALGAADYLVIGQNFHTVFVSNVPKLTLNEQNWMRRFIIFVDSMYECNVKLIIHAAASPEGLFEVDLENKAMDEAFAFDRTRSRLEEMRSDEYLKKRWSGARIRAQARVNLDPSLSDHAIKSKSPKIGAKANIG